MTPKNPIFKIGAAVLEAPQGWSENIKDEGRLVLRSEDGRQQATVTTMAFKGPSFEDFKRICTHRLTAEKEFLKDGVVQSDEPFQLGQRFGMYFFGVDKADARSFSGFLSLANGELVTVYLEGPAVERAAMMSSFKIFVSTLKHS